ncbi:hypothetical protein AB0F91_34835 [Amycolatopsis sp. NPDC023774]
MRREWKTEELIAGWTLLDGDWELATRVTGVTPPGFSPILKGFR